MREIKFRAKYDGAEGGFVYTDKNVPWSGHKEEDGVCGLSLVEGIWGVSHSGSSNDWGPLENVSQFTGLHDNNGKEIWEGDVVKVVNNVTKIDRGVVEWQGGGFVAHEEGVGYQGIRDWGANTEVIGNIYESPELLSNEK